MRSMIRPIRRRSDIDFLFGSIFDDARQAAQQVASGVRGALRLQVPLELSETDDELHLTAELPGVRADQLEITVTGDVLTLSGEKRAPAAAAEGEREDDATPSDQRRTFTERVFGAFRRELKLPFAVDASAVEAEFTDGVLSVRLPKSDSERPRRIEVKTTPRIDARAAAPESAPEA